MCSLIFFYILSRLTDFRYWLTDCRDYDDGIEQSAGECPLYITLFLAVPSFHLHFYLEAFLEVLRTNARYSWTNNPLINRIRYTRNNILRAEAKNRYLNHSMRRRETVTLSSSKAFLVQLSWINTSKFFVIFHSFSETFSRMLLMLFFTCKEQTPREERGCILPLALRRSAHDDASQ